MMKKKYVSPQSEEVIMMIAQPLLDNSVPTGDDYSGGKILAPMHGGSSDWSSTEDNEDF